MDALFSPAFSQSILFCFSILFDYDFRLPAHKSTESEEKDTFLLQSSGAIFFFLAVLLGLGPCTLAYTLKSCSLANYQRQDKRR